jgi:hypothetical protein
MDPEGEAIHAWVLVNFMMRVDVEVRTDIFNLSEGALEQATTNLVSSKSGSSLASLVASSFPFSKFL